MGQNRAERLICKGKLKLETSLHTTGNNGLHSDSPFYLDNEGHPVLRGSSICGALLNFLYDTCDKEKIKEKITFWKNYFPGFASKFSKNQREENQISSLYFYDARAEVSTPKMIKDSTSINREYGTAAEEHKFDYEIVPPGTEFSFLFEAFLPGDSDEELFEEIVFYLLAALKEGLIFFGAKSSAGLGRVKLVNSSVYFVDFRDKNHLKNFLLERDNKAYSTDWDYLDDTYKYIRKSEQKKLCYYLKNDLPWYRFDITANSGESYPFIHFNFAPLMVKSGYEGKHTDSEFMTIKSSEGDLFYFPGSSLKGVFRSSAEFILNTIFTSNSKRTPCKVLDKDKACSGKFRNKDKLSIDIIAEKLCPACLLFGSDKVLASSIYFEDIFLKEAETKKSENVAINRFTGGVNTSAKFNDEAVVRWKMNTKISVRFHHNKDLNFLLALIFLILREAEDGYLLHGSGKYRGKGIVRWKIDKLEKFCLNSSVANEFFKWEEKNVEEFKKELNNTWKEFILDGG